MFTGLSAFPLTPFRGDGLGGKLGEQSVAQAVDEQAFIGLIERLAASGVDSITALGSTGSYAYLSTPERARVAQLAVAHAGGTPVHVGVGALRTSDVLENVRHAEDAGASGILLAPMTYQPLTADDVFELFRTVSERTALPVIVYDNPGTTHFTFTTDLYRRIAALPGIASIKIPGVPADPGAARAHIDAIRAAIPDTVTIGVSGDAFAAAGLNAGCDTWYSVIGGTLPEAALSISRPALAGNADAATAESERLAPLWSLFAEFGGSLRVVAAIAEHLGFAPPSCLPLPIQGLSPDDKLRAATVAKALGLSR